MQRVVSVSHPEPLTAAARICRHGRSKLLSRLRTRYWRTAVQCRASFLVFWYFCTQVAPDRWRSARLGLVDLWCYFMVQTSNSLPAVETVWDRDLLLVLPGFRLDAGLHGLFKSIFVTLQRVYLCWGHWGGSLVWLGGCLRMVDCCWLVMAGNTCHIFWCWSF